VPFKKRLHPGWLAISRHADHFDLVHVQRNPIGKPQVMLCESYRSEGSDAAMLVRLRKALKFEQYHCTTLLNNQEYQMHQLDAPNVPAAELKAAVRWRLQDVIDYPLEGATIDVLEIPGDGNAPARARSVYAVSARNTVIEACIKPFAEAKVALEVIDVPDLAQRNLASLFESDGRGVAMLAFYENEGILTFTRNGELFLTRRIETSLPELMEADATSLSAHLERIALEFQRSLDHVEGHFRYVPIGKLVLAPLPKDIGLQAYLASNLYIPVEVGDLASVLDFTGAPELRQAERQSHCYATIGAALRDSEQHA
jgi:MSHA biogenesis protein MshI